MTTTIWRISASLDTSLYILNLPRNGQMRTFRERNIDRGEQEGLFVNYKHFFMKQFLDSAFVWSKEFNEDRREDNTLRVALVKRESAECHVLARKICEIKMASYWFRCVFRFFQHIKEKKITSYPASRLLAFVKSSFAPWLVSHVLLQKAKPERKLC